MRTRAWAHGFGIPLEMTNSVSIATEIRNGPPTAALIDGIFPVNFRGQENVFQYIRSDLNESATVDLLDGFKQGDMVIAGDFTTDSARQKYQSQQQAGIIFNLLAGAGVGVTPYIAYKIYKYLKGEKGIDLNKKVGGRRSFFKFIALTVGLSAFSGIAIEKLSELRRMLAAADVNNCKISPIVTLSDHEDPDSADLYDRTRFDLEKMNGIPQKEFTERGLNNGVRINILGTAHYFPSVMRRLNADNTSISNRAEELVTREARFYAMHGYKQDEAVQRLNRIVVLMARSMFMQVVRLNDNMTALQPIPNRQSDIYYYDPRILPDYFSYDNKINQTAVVRLFNKTKADAKIV